MKNLLLTCLLFLFVSSAFSQNLTQEVLWTQNSVFAGFGYNQQMSDSKGNTYHAGGLVPGLKVDVNPSTDTFFIQSPVGGAYVLKINVNGEFEWAKPIIGRARISTLKIYNDSIYILGTFSDSIDLNPDTTRFMRYDLGRFGSNSLFYVILDQNGNFKNGNKISYLGAGSNNISANSLQFGGDGSLHIFGVFTGKYDFNAHPVDSSIQQNINSAPFLDHEFFYLKLHPNLSFNFVKHWTNASVHGTSDLLYYSAIDQQDNVYISGQVTSAVDFDPGPGVTMIGSGATNDNGTNSFISKFDSSGTFLWAKSFEKTSDAVNNAASHGKIVIAPNHKIYLAGFFIDSVDFDPSPAIDLRVANRFGYYVAQFEQNGQLNWVRTLVYPNNRVAVYDLEADAASNLYLSIGTTDTLDFDYTNNTAFYYNLAPSILKTDENFNFQWIKEFPGVRSIYHISFVGSSDTLFLCGDFNDSVVFNTSTHPVTLFTNNPFGAKESFIAKCLAGSGAITALEDASFRFNAEQDFTAFPNPTNGTIQLQAQHSTIQRILVRNSVGQIVNEISSVNSKAYLLEMGGTQGLYLIEIHDKLGKRTTLKVLKQ